MPKQGDVVLYSAFGRTLQAIVLDARLGEVSHHGKNNEPVLDLIFIDPARETAIEKKQIGYKPHVYTEYDVVHHSHEFPVEFRKLKGLLTPAQIMAARGQGEWREVITIEQERADEYEKLRDELARWYSSVAPVIVLSADGKPTDLLNAHRDFAEALVREGEDAALDQSALDESVD